MSVERIPIVSREQWLAERAKDVTASAVAALFGAHPYQTALGLYAEKSGVSFPDKDSKVMRRGRLLEPVVAEIVREKRPDWKLEKADVYLRDPGLRLGATPDYFITCLKRGRGVLQIKTAGPRAFKDNWLGEGDTIVPPLYSVLQAATEMMLEDATWAAVAVMVVDAYDLDAHIAEFDRHRASDAKIRAGVAKFWADVAAEKEPGADYALDADLIGLMHPRSVPEKVIDLTGDNRFAAVVVERQRLAGEIKALEISKKEAETEIKAKMGDAEVALVNGQRLTTWKTQHRDAYSVAANSFRVLRFTDGAAAPRGSKKAAGGKKQPIDDGEKF